MEKRIFELLKERLKERRSFSGDYGDDLCSKQLSSLIRKRAEYLECENEIVGLSEIEAVRLIQRREHNTDCYCGNKPYVHDGYDANRCGAQECLWKTSCEIYRKGYRKVFMSYVHGDESLARNLSRRLDKEGVHVWYDEWEIGSHLRDEIAYSKIYEALSNVDAVVVLDTDSYSSSRYKEVVNYSTSVTSAYATKPYLDFESDRWIDHWHEGVYFKVIKIDCRTLANDKKSFSRVPLKNKKLTYWGSGASRVKGRGYSHYEENYQINIVPTQITGYELKQSDNILGEAVCIPLDIPLDTSRLLKELKR